MRLPVEIGERHTGIDTWLASLNLKPVTDDEDGETEVSDAQDFVVMETSRTGHSRGLHLVTRSTQRPHEEYGEVPPSPFLGGRLLMDERDLPPDWQPKVSFEEERGQTRRLAHNPLMEKVTPRDDFTFGLGRQGNSQRDRPMYAEEEEVKKRERYEDPSDLDQLLAEFPDVPVEEEVDPSDAAIEAETKNDLGPRPDQQLAQMLIGNKVIVSIGPLSGRHGKVGSWKRRDDGDIWLTIAQEDLFGDPIPAAPMEVRMTDVERYRDPEPADEPDIGHLEDAAAQTMADEEYEAAARGELEEDDGSWAMRRESQPISEIELHEIKITTEPAPHTSIEVVEPELSEEEASVLGLVGKLVMLKDHPERQGVVLSYRTHHDPDLPGFYLDVSYPEGPPGRNGWNAWPADVEVLTDDPCPDCGMVHNVQRHCRFCNCIQAHACEEGCTWVADDICSACYDKQGLAPDTVIGVPSPDHVNPPVEKTPEEVKTQKEKGTRKLIKAKEDLECWKKEDLPYLVEQVKIGYDPNSHRMFARLTEDQTEELWETLYRKKLATRTAE